MSAELNEANFDSTKLASAFFRKTVLPSCSFRSAMFDGTVFSEAVLSDFDGAGASGSVLGESVATSGDGVTAVLDTGQFVRWLTDRGADVTAHANHLSR